MKVLITSEVYKPVINGVVTSLLNLEEGLLKDGNDVRILTLSNSHRSYKKDNVYYMASLGAENIYPNARVTWPINNALVQELIEWCPDVIHTQTEFSTFLFAKKIAKATDAPIIHTYHTVYEQYTHYLIPSKRIGKQIVKYFTRYIAKKTDKIIVPSKKIYDMLSEYHVSVPMEIVPSGIDYEEFAEEKKDTREIIREKYNINNDECLLISVGRVAKEKNLDEILKYLSNDKSNHIRLMIVGDGPYLEPLKQRAKEFGVFDRLIFVGMVAREEVKDYYPVGDVFVNASTSETQGLTYIEAMASGLAVLCRKDACLKGVIEQGVNGFQYENEDEFLTILNQLVSDKKLRTAIGNKAMQTVKKEFSTDAFARSCESLYKDII